MKLGMNIELDIGNLVLHGFPTSDKDLIARAIQMELERLFAEEGVPSSFKRGNDVAFLDSGSFDIISNSDPELVGIQMARTLYGCFK